MLTDAPTLPKACREHIDLINQQIAAGNHEQAFYLAFQYFRARVKHIQGRRRQEDADAFRRGATRLLAELAGQVHDHAPRDDYRDTSLIPGGDWRP